MSEKRRIVVNTLANGTAQVASMIAAFVFMPFLIRGFGIANFGLYMLAGAVGSYAALLDFGVGASLVKMIAERSASDDHEDIVTLASSALAFYTIIGVVIAVILVVLGIFAGSVFHVTPDGARLLRNLLFVVAVFQLWNWPAATANYVLGGFQQYATMAKVGLVVTLVNLGTVMAVLYFHQGPLVLLVAQGLVGVAGTLVMITLASRCLRGRRLSPLHAKFPALKSIFMFSWAIFVVQIVTIVLYQQTDRLVLGIFIGASAITLYEASGKFQGFIAQLTSFATSAVMPLASQFQAEGRQSSIEGLYLRGSRYTAALITPVVVTLIVLARPLITTWLGPLFATQSLAAQILVFPQLLMMTAILGDEIIIGLGKLPERLPYAIAIMVGNLVLSVILVQKIGILGVVLGTSIPYLIDYPFHVRLQLRQVGVPFSRWFRQIVVPVYPLLLLPAAISFIALRSPYLTHLISVGIAAMLSLGAYWVVFFFVGLSKPERDEILSAAASLRDRYLPQRG